MKMTNFIEQIIEEIQKAEEQAYLNQIKTNSIILNENHTFVKEFYLEMKYFMQERRMYVPPMILGKKLFIGPLPDDYDFALGYLGYVAEPKEDTFIELIKKHVKIVGHGEHEQLAFKGISSKRNKKDFEAIKKILLGVDYEN